MMLINHCIYTPSFISTPWYFLPPPFSITHVRPTGAPQEEGKLQLRPLVRYILSSWRPPFPIRCPSGLPRAMPFQGKFTYYSKSVPSFTAMSSYSCLLFAISSGQPRQVSWEAATREARVSPEIKAQQVHCMQHSTFQSRQTCACLALLCHLLQIQQLHITIVPLVGIFCHSTNTATPKNSRAKPCKAPTVPGIETIGVPAQSTSMPVVWPLQRGVSRQTSASWPLRTCSSLGATGEKMMRFWGRPMFCAYC